VEQLQEAGSELVAAANNITTLFVKMSGLGCARPTQAQVQAVASRALATMVMRTPFRNQVGGPFLAVNERREWTDLLQYSQTIRADAQGRLGEHDNNKQDAAA
jgi:hypothetical protein